MIKSGTRVFLWCSFLDRKGMRKKEKIRKKKGKRLSPSAAFSDQILIPWQTIECTRLNNSRSLEFTREERGRNVGSFSWTAAARSSPKKSDGYFFFWAFSRKLFSPLHRCAYSLHCSRSFSGEFKGLFLRVFISFNLMTLAFA